ncbi:MAG TPA: NADH-quinone oxidoreductase subunit NuoE [Ruania sp.]|nr:NADH-quinone oxidoreductase subunit NuoE [Ruania sp.]
MVNTQEPARAPQQRRQAYPEDVAQRLHADAEEILSRYPQARSALLPLLHLVQSEDGYVSPAGIAFCAEKLDLSRASVSAVATFYSQYKRHPNGQYTVGVCTNTLCAVMGGDAIFDRLSDHLGIGHDETTEDGAITLERIECNAACDYAPVMMINWEYFDNMSPGVAEDIVDRLIAGETVAPTRGADSVASFKEVSRVLAGFDDGRGDEGGTPGEATLAGLRVAQQQGWSAPGGQEPTAVDPQAGEAGVAGSGSSAERKPHTEGDVSPSGPTGEPDSEAEQKGGAQ